jgi:selenocysteine-specific elongation factor
LRVEAAPRRARRRLALESLQQQKTFFGGVDLESDAGRRRRVEFALGQTPAVAMSVDALARAVILPPGEVATAVRDLAAGGIAIEFGDGLFALKERMAALEADVARRLGGMAAESGKLRAPMSDLRRGWTVPNAVWERCCADLAATGRLRVVGEVVLLAASMEDLPDGERALAERMMALFEKEGYETTHPDEVHAKLNATPAQARRMLDYLCGRGDLVRVAPNVVLTRSRLRAAQEYVIETIRANGALASPAFRDYLGVSRKYAMAILDFMDVRRITLRVQNDRRLLPGWEQRRL